MALPDTSQRARQLVDSLLDRGYTQTAQATVDAILRSGSSGIMRQRLQELADEAARLAELGQKLSPTNPVLRAIRADLDDLLRAQSLLIDRAATEAQARGVQLANRTVRELALPGISDDVLARLGVNWRVPDIEALQSLVQYTESEAWAASLARYQQGVSSAVNNAIIRGFVEGRGPLAIAADIRRIITQLPASYADGMMRTLMLQSYRTGAVANRVANSDILTEQIRIAVLDDRTCLACWSLHGSKLAINERIDDHQRGRCDSIAIVRGRSRNVERGADVFERLPRSRQRSIMGPANYDAFRAGRVTLQDYVTPYTDDIYGAMIREQSLVGLLGSEAQQFYQ